MCESRSRTTSWPARVWLTTETTFPIVPEATKRPASLPSRSAAIASSRLTVGSSSQTSSPTSARAMASRISGVGSVSVSDRRSTMSCTWLPLGSETNGRPPAPLGEPVLDRQAAEQLDRLVLLALVEVHLGEQEERFRNHEGSRIVLEHELEALARRARVALIEVVRRHPQLFLGQPPPAHVDLREGVREVAALRVFLDELSELVERLLREALILLDRLELIVVAHREPELCEVGDLMPWEEGQEGLELTRRLVEFPLSVVGLADEEPPLRRVRRVRMSLDDLSEVLSRFVVPLVVQLGLAELVELFRRQDRRRRGPEHTAAARDEQQADQEDARANRKVPWHRNWPIHIAHSKGKSRLSRAKPSGVRYACLMKPELPLAREGTRAQIDQARAALQSAIVGVKSAESAVDESRARLEARQAATAAMRADVAGAQTTHRQSARELERARSLLKSDLVARRDFDQAESAYETAGSTVEALQRRMAQTEREVQQAEAELGARLHAVEQARQRVAEARAMVALAGSQIHQVAIKDAEVSRAEARLREAQADLSVAELQLGHTEVRAPLEGVVSKRSVEIGQVVQMGQPLLALVPLQDVWVVANFKETQLARLKAGMKARVEVDGYPDKTYSGTLESMSAGTGSRFSLLPPENATDRKSVV